jgi:HK97 family phage major capsid protein
MAGFTASNNEHLIRSNLWSSQIKEVLEDELIGTKYVDMIADFPDGDTVNIPSIGQAETYDYEEGQAVRYTAMDTGNFTFSITDYKASATYITNRMKQDSMYMSRLVSSFVPKQSRAISVAMEADIMAVGNAGQTASNLNVINNAWHRWVATGTNDTITVNDFARAKYALQVANVPMTNLVAVVDPSVEYTLSTISNLTNVSNNPKWEGIVRDGMSTGMRFVMNIYGFDVYMSNYLPSGISETINSNSVTNGVANYFFSATPDVLPFVGSVRQPPKVDSEYNKDLQREEYVTTCRYGFKLFRPENLVTVITDRVSAVA